MKLIIQIPCFNEQDTLAGTLRDLPTHIDGIDEIQILIIDDGSTDDTLHVAYSHNVTQIVRHSRNRGLAAAFASGLDVALQLGADIIVNTDADNQYPGRLIPQLIAPIIAGHADLVIGDRGTWENQEFSLAKRVLQRTGSLIMSLLVGDMVADAVSGFRAMSRSAALKMNIVTDFSYTLESILQARNRGLTIRFVPIKTNASVRASRLYRSIPEFVARSAATIIRVYAMCQSMTVFLSLACCLFVVGALPIVRFLYFFASGHGNGHVQSLVLGGVAILGGCVAIASGVLADLVSCNRRLLEATLEKVRNIESHISVSLGSDVALRSGAPRAESPATVVSCGGVTARRSPHVLRSIVPITHSLPRDGE